MGVTNDNLQAKYAVALLEGKALTWWRGMAGEHSLDSLSWRDLCTYLEDEFQDIDRKLKLRRQIQGLRHTESVQKYANAFRTCQLELGGARLDDSAATF